MIAIIVALIVGTAIPGLTAIVTKLNASSKLKAFVSAVLAAIGGALSGVYIDPPPGGRWEQVVLSAILAIIAAASLYAGLWKPSGAAPALAKMSPNFGLGAGPPAPESDVAA